jgi:CheY-like chemotaxis protein
MDQQQKYEVLVVEDEPSLKEAINLKLTKAGLDSTIFDNGRLALDAITTRGKHFDGIWLDFDIHEINGLEFMQRLVTMPGWEACPVLIVSNTGNPELIRQAIELGAKEWIIKAEVRLDDTVSRFIEIITKTKAAL